MSTFLDNGYKMNNKKRIYLAGSFYDFRDRIIEALPDMEFSDPRTHRQNSIAQLVEDDMKDAAECPVMFACFPRGKARGTMTYAEIGAAKAKGNYIIIADENEQTDYNLNKIADLKFNKIDEAIEFIKHVECGKNGREIIKTSPDDKFRIFLTTNHEYTEGLEKIAQNGKKIITSKEIDSVAECNHMDLIVAHFPKGLERDRRAIFMMGMSYSIGIPICILDENPIIYPPLAGLARRIFTQKEPFLDYLNMLKSQKIDDEAKVMYHLFEKYKS
jgi:hypothetical protein